MRSPSWPSKAVGKGVSIVRRRRPRRRARSAAGEAMIDLDPGMSRPPGPCRIPPGLPIADRGQDYVQLRNRKRHGCSAARQC